MIGNTNSKSNVEPPLIVSWGGGSEEEVTVMIQEHYDGRINITEYWDIGDTRTESITAIAYDNTTQDSQPAQSIDLIIIGLNHDNLSDGSGMAAITVQTTNTLSTTGIINPSYGVTYSLWSTSGRRTWCNNKFKTALPTWLQSLIKTVSKVTNRHGNTGYETYRGQTSTTDDVFLLSEFETFGSAFGGSTYGDVGSDGTQYEFMKTQSNRVKSGGSTVWWTRSSLIMSGYSNFVCIGANGMTFVNGIADEPHGIAPAFCL
jgi:hypothetical protein